MKRRFANALVLVTLLLTSHSVLAVGASGEFTIIPSVGVQLKNLEFKEALLLEPGGVTEKGSLEADIPTYTLGLTFGYKRFYLALKYEDTITEAVASSDVPFTNPDNIYYLEHGPSDTKVERRDFNLTFGANVWKGLGAFIGYMDGETRFNPVPSAVNFGFNNDDLSLIRPENQAFCANFATECRDTNLAQDHEDDDLVEYRQVYQEDGVFLGLSYAWSIGDAGTLAISGAYAWLNGTYKDNYAVVDNQDFLYKGDADGVSLGVAWTGQLSETVGYFIDLRTQAYEMDGDDKSGNFEDSTVSTEETITGLSAGFRWVF